ncbi:Tyrosine-protein phosphatase yvh1 [Phlyctema vagabunda]|uniref:protein-tyrosine-phosphatase n=1 Tax=Phlyctema vagabunda TaxID=108571 RepID=A0ABR4PWE5_9HELO
MALSRVPGDDDLYVGGIFTLRRRSTLADSGITHIVSVLKYDFRDFEDWEKYEHLSIEVDDVDDENLLGEFENSGAWIAKALKEGKEGRKGKVLVHCAMGKSRSVTIAVAYLLRQYPHHTVASALELIRESRPIAEPNDGFMQQLELYKDMGCPRDIEAQPKYQRWLYQREVDLALAAGMAPDKIRFEDEEAQDAEASEGKQVELRCKRCRRTLATSPYILAHDAKKPSQTARGPIASLAELSTAPSNSCTHHFLHPLSWMRPALEQGLLSGRLECPNAKCGAQIGRYAWQGLRCSCGVWICPAFSLQKGRVDEVGFVPKGQIKSQSQQPTTSGSGEAVAGGIRLPPGMRGKQSL